MSKSSIKKIYIVNELTLWPMVARAILGKNVYILEISPTFHWLADPIRSLLKPLMKWRNVTDARLLAPKWDSIWEYPLRATFYDVFGKTESWHNEHFDYDNTSLINHYDIFAYKQITCNYMKPIHARLIKLHGIIEAQGHDSIIVVGEDCDSELLRDAYVNGNVLSRIASSTSTLAHLCINILILLSTSMLTMFWILSRIRPGLAPAEEYFLGADYYPNSADFRIYDEVSPNAPILLIKRNKHQPIHFPEIQRHHIFKTTDGRLDVLQGVRLIGRTLRDNARHFRNAATRRPAHYYLLAMIPLRRAIFVALFRRFRCKVFWGRDDYNVEHILRREQLNAVGGKSFGIAHGMPTYAVLFPMWRYISFDTYYLHSPAICEGALRDTWDKNMRIVPIGSFRAEREDYTRIEDDRPNDIIIYVASFVGDPRMRSFVREMAEAFLDRTVYLQIKSTFEETDFGIAFIDACRKDLPNVKHTTAPMFDLFRMAKYGFSDPSTMVVEGLQFGQITFFADIMHEQQASIYRDFPSICVTSAEDAIQRIHAIEDGREEDPRPGLANLVHFSSTPFFDVLKKDMGSAQDETLTPGGSV